MSIGLHRWSHESAWSYLSGSEFEQVSFWSIHKELLVFFMVILIIHICYIQESLKPIMNHSQKNKDSAHWVIWIEY